MEAGTDETSTGGLVGVAGIIGEAGVGKGDTIGDGEMGGGEVGVGIVGGFDGELGIVGAPDGGGDPEDGCPGRETGGRGIGDCVGDLGKSFSYQVPGIKAIGRIQVAVR